MLSKKDRERIEDMVREIEGESFGLINYRDLYKNASKESIIQALKHDKKWERDHHDEVVGRFDDLIIWLENKDWEDNPDA